MRDRSVLGAADVSDDALAAMVRRQLGVDDAEPLEVLACGADVAPYDLEALTTAGRYWVRGVARTGEGERPFSFFVKVVQSWARSPVFAFVPPEMRAVALAGLPWEVEPAVYRTDLAQRLPVGLRMPTAYAVVDLDAESAALWLEEVDVVEERWGPERFARAAHLLGRLAASPGVRTTVGAGRTGSMRLVRGYAEGRVAHQVVPALRSPEVWEHPLVAGAFDDALRGRLLAAADAVGAMVDELERLPVGTLHGDACTRNLLVQSSSPDFALIDYGFWGEGPLGFDLGQLLVGEVQTGERPAAELPELEAVCLPAYVDGLRAEGCEAPADDVQRAHALLMLLFSGLSAVPLEHLGAEPTAELQRVAGERAAAARYSLDLVDATA